MAKRKQRGPDLIRQPEQHGEVVQNDELSTFGVVLAIALCGVVFAFAPLALTLPSASIGSDFLLSCALSLMLWAIGIFVSELSELRRFFQHEGWSDLFVTLALALLPSVPFSLFLALDFPSWTERALTGATLLLCLPVCLGVGATVDAFFIRPHLRPKPSRAERRGSSSPQAPSVGGMLLAFAALITWGLSNMASFLTILDQLFPGD